MFCRILAALALLICLFNGVPVWADACVSNASGSWHAAGTWTSCGGSFPTVGDTATIQAAHTVTVDTSGDSVGTGPADPITYDLDIAGTLQFDPNVDIRFDVYSSVRVQNGGHLYIGTEESPIECDNFVWFRMNTTDCAASDYNILIEDGGNMTVHGCENYPATSGSNMRARIASCTPNCSAGVIDINLDRTVNWDTSARPDPMYDGDGFHRLIVGCGGGTTAPGGDCAEILNDVVDADADSMTVVTANDHQPGDIVLNVTRNVLIDTTDACQGASIYTMGTAVVPLNLSWATVDQFGSTNYAAIYDSAAGSPGGTFDNVAAVRCSGDGGGGTMTGGCFYLDRAGWAKIDGLMANARDQYCDTTYCFYFAGSAVTAQSMPNLSGVDCHAAWITSQLATPIILSAPWFSEQTGTDITEYGLTGTFSSITDGLFHYSLNVAIRPTTPADKPWQGALVLDGNEFLHAKQHASLLPTNLRMTDNTFHDSTDGCVSIAPVVSMGAIGLFVPFSVYASGNTYNECNTDGYDFGGALAYLGIAGGMARHYRESFGATVANESANIVFFVHGANNINFACDECTLTTPDSQPTDWSYPVQVFPYPLVAWAAADIWKYVERLGAESFIGLQNRGDVANATWTMGPYGATIEYESVTKRDSTLNMKITPYGASRPARIPVRRVYVADGDVLSVSVYLRKTESVSAGRRPKLVLSGPGFDPTVKYAEMPNTNDTWEQVSVSGTADALGLVQIYIEVIGQLDGGTSEPFDPVMPPALVVYADGLAVTKTP